MSKIKCALCGAEYGNIPDAITAYYHPATGKCALASLPFLSEFSVQSLNAAIEAAKVDKDVFIAGMEFGYKHGTGGNVTEQCWTRYKNILGNEK